MSEARATGSDPAVLLSRAHELVDDLQRLDLTGLGDEALLSYWRELERLRRRLPTAEHALVLDAEARGLPDAVHARSTGAFLRALLRLDPGEANARVKAAHAAGPRRALTGEPLPAIYPEVAAAQADGSISERHARIVIDTIEKLPDGVAAEHGERIEQDLVNYAAQFDPTGLAKLAERVSACYDPDGRLKDVEYRERHRDISVQRRVDGSGRMTVEGTAELMELLALHFDALAKPKPDQDGLRDPRTAGQRRHDALLEAMRLNLRAQQLPSVSGVLATIVVTMSAEQYATGTGLASTSHGALVPVPEALQWAGGDYRLMNLVINKTRGIEGYSSLQRCFTEQQRLALAALDRGCTFPGCDTPAPWCEIDHAQDHAKQGPTRVDNGLLACRYHNNTAKKQGWKSKRINNRAAWTPPRWIDPEQKPRYNQLHQ